MVLSLGLDVTQSHLDGGCNLLSGPLPFPDHSSYTIATGKFSLAELSSASPLCPIQALQASSDALGVDAQATPDKQITAT